MKNMPLLKIEQDSHKIFKRWHYASETGEAVIVVQNDDSWKITEELPEAVITHKRIYGLWRGIRILDPMWLISYDVKDKEQALQFQQVINVCYDNDINFGKIWNSNWRKLEGKEQRKKERKEAIIVEVVRKALLRRFQIADTYNRLPPTDQTPIESEERRRPRKYFFVH
ncbi:hypothetical protein Hanom_Chr10g00911401 [Helianthus anomalus]